MFWLEERQERDVKRAFCFYGPLAWYDISVDNSTVGKPIWRFVLKRLRRLARWRVVNGRYAVPFEMWLNSIFGRVLPRGEDDGIGPPDDILDAPRFMGEEFGVEPLPEPEADGSETEAAGSASPITRA